MNEAFGSNDKANTTTQKSMGAAAMIRGCKKSPSLLPE